MQVQVRKLNLHTAFQELSGLPKAMVFKEGDTTSLEMSWQFVGAFFASPSDWGNVAGI